METDYLGFLIFLHGLHILCIHVQEIWGEIFIIWLLVIENWKSCQQTGYLFKQITVPTYNGILCNYEKEWSSSVHLMKSFKIQCLKKRETRCQAVRVESSNLCKHKMGYPYMYTSMYYVCVSHMYTHLCLCIPRMTFWENSSSREWKMLVETYLCIV